MRATLKLPIKILLWIGHPYLNDAMVGNPLVSVISKVFYIFAAKF